MNWQTIFTLVQKVLHWYSLWMYVALLRPNTGLWLLFLWGRGSSLEVGCTIIKLIETMYPLSRLTIWKSSVLLICYILKQGVVHCGHFKTNLKTQSLFVNFWQPLEIHVTFQAQKRQRELQCATTPWEKINSIVIIYWP